MITQKLTPVLLALIELIFIQPLIWAKYVPPPQQERPGDYAKSAGVRTGVNSLAGELPLVLLAPQTYVGHSLSIKPSFVWLAGHHLEDYETNFRLFEINEKGNIQQLGEPLVLQSQAGINILSFPGNQSLLQVGKKYLWQVAIPQGKGDWFIQRAEFRVVAPPSNLAAQLTKLTKTFERAELYAEQGFWYDALAESLKSACPRKFNMLSANLVSTLVESDNLFLNEAIEKPMFTQRANYIMQVLQSYQTGATANCQ